MKGVLLLSGGIDSPVAGKMMQERGMDLVAVHFHTQPFTDEESEEKSRKIADMLGIKLYVAPFGEQSAEIVKKCNQRYYFLLTRRVMWRVAENIAEKEKARFLVTGENLGQVSSQTLDNLAVTDQCVNIPILRPLLGNDKVETIALAEQYGTFETSKGPEVCNTLGPNHPVTRSKVDKVLEEEDKINMDAMVEKALSQSKTVSNSGKKQKSVEKL